ncbi:MAG: hypothetical protein DSZ32_07325 [Gammaproteobacteria bacterium]|nr:MAG: hypothetical protein DSZ32_07325 [Gammaproteobacteria bacterium]
MRLFFFLLCLLFGSAAAATEQKTELLQPPASLEQWYKPAAKRQIWLHNMFKLRREIQAIEEYAELEDQARLEKWTGRFLEHYRKIGDMVPEWKDELDHQWAGRLAEAASSGDFNAAARATRKLGRSCQGCHDDYRAVVAVLYRSPDFSQQTIDTGGEGKQKYKKYMETLTRYLNRMKIAVEDQRTDAALDAFGKLDAGIGHIARDCVSCHKQPEIGQNYLNNDLRASLQKLETAIKAGDQREAGMTLGEVAVTACARCHGTHRMLYDLKQELK